MGETELWIVFAAIFAVLICADFLVADRKPHSLSQKESVRNVLVFVAIAVAFGVLVLLVLGQDMAASYYAAYVIEFAMSVDNLFVFLIIFAAFGIRDMDEHKVLFYGILGAIAFRALFVFIGAELLNSFHWMMLIFGAILIYAAYRTAFGKGEDKPAEETFAYRLTARIKTADGDSGGKFFVRVDGKLIATSMFVCLLVIELTDIIFAFDSIPAALSITTDIFIVLTSNLFAVLGLRSLFFVLKNALNSLCYLSYGLACILGFIGAKMFAAYFGFEVPVVASLLIILAILAVTIAASRIAAKKTGGSAR